MNLDAYTVRKAVPRILVAAIGINLSIYFCVAAVDITNIIGRGIADLLTQPFLDPNTFAKLQVPSNAVTNGVPIGGALIGSLIVGGAIFTPAITGAGVLAAGSTLALGVLGFLVPMMITIALISLAIMFTLVIRQALLVFLTVVSPVAIALFVLPGTEKYFKSWFDLFIKTLLVYPIIAVLFAMSTVMGAILLGTAGSNPAGIGLVVVLAVVVVVFAPLILIPFAFKLAGGAIGALMNATSARAGGLSQRAGKRFGDWRKNPESILGKYSAKKRDEAMRGGATGGQVFGGLARGYSNRKQGLSFREGYALGSAAPVSSFAQRRLEELDKHIDYQPIKGNDDALMVGASFKDENGVWRVRDRQEQDDYLKQIGIDDAGARSRIIASVDRAKAGSSQEVFDQFAAAHLPGTGTGFKGGGFAEMAEFIAHASGDDRVLEGNLMAQARSKATEARRYDLVPGFGTSMALAQDSRDYHAGTMSAEKLAEVQEYGGIDNYLNAKATDNVLFTQGAGAIVGGRGDSVKNLTETVNRRMEAANKKYNEVVKNPYSTEEQKAAAAKERKRVLASTAAMLDVAGQISPENAQLLADGGKKTYTDARGVKHTEQVEGVLTRSSGGQIPVFDKDGKQVGSRAATVAEEIEHLRNDPEFGQYRREYTNSTAAQANSLAAASAAAASGKPPAGTAQTGVS